ncbi:DegT/DnrJ/EryC1/StrS family aminotransferase [Blastopirellula marina]|uniref:DegT/DnrJ/EryC1/StrS family aminotransferase n=1 Tax=Blastopirellula marina TaxID=124 RepID=UPI001304CE42|nr:aminotransferase class V-fold PLP-dependent enzyme [Blastopirellula marina]
MGKTTIDRPTNVRPPSSEFDPTWNEWPLAEEPAVKEALLRAYEDGSWGRYHGPHVERLEAELAQMHGVKHALVCASGTIAVQIALRSLNPRPGDEVILAAYDFPGNFRAIQDAGQFPVLVDIDPRTWCLDPEQIEGAIGEKTVAIIVSHLHGGQAKMARIKQIAQSHGIAVIEDACQATGAIIEGKRAGAAGDVGVLSFGGSKLITAGRGGALLTDRDDCVQRAKIFCERGNHAFPLSELQAAVILPQLKQLDARNRTRDINVQRLRESLRELEEKLRPVEIERDRPAFYKHAWLCDSAARAERIVALAEVNQLPIGAGFRGFLKRPSSQTRKSGKLPASEAASRQTILLHHPILLKEREAIDWIAQWLRTSVEEA